MHASDVFNDAVGALYGEDRSARYRRTRKKAAAYTSHIDAYLSAFLAEDAAVVVGTVLEDAPAASGADDEYDLPPEAYTSPSATLPVAFGPIAEGQSVEERTFYMPADDVARVRAEAEKLGCSLTVVEDVNPNEMVDWITSMVKSDPRVTQDRPAIRAFVASVIKDFVEVRVEYPKPDYSIIATAELLSHDKSPTGKPMVQLSQTEAYWSEERIHDLDFTRCDKCGVRSRRKYVYIVVPSARSEKAVQLGGSCAAHLDLGKRLRDMTKAIASVITYIWEILRAKGYAEEYDEGGGRVGYRLKRPIDVPAMTALIDFVISKLGYMSRTKADETNDIATSSIVSGIDMNFDRGDRLAGDIYSAVMRAYTPPHSPRLDYLLTRMRALAEDPKLTQDVLFRTSFQNAVYGGFGLGMLCFAVNKARTGESLFRAVIGKARPWSTQVENEDAQPAAYSDLDAVAKRSHWPSVVDMLTDILGEKDAVKEIKMYHERPDAILNTKLAKAMSRHPQGLWQVLSKISRMGEYGMWHKATLIRIDDYRLAEVSGGGASQLEKDQVVRIVSASKAGIGDSRTLRGASAETDIVIPGTMKLNRAEIEVVPGIRGIVLGDAPPVPELSIDVTPAMIHRASRP